MTEAVGPGDPSREVAIETPVGRVEATAASSPRLFSLGVRSPEGVGKGMPLHPDQACKERAAALVLARASFITQGVREAAVEGWKVTGCSIPSGT